MSRTVTALSLLGVCVLGFALRAIGFEGVFAGDHVLLAIGDGQYHARLAIYTLVNYPDLLVWDGYVNYPDGSSLPAVPVLAFAAATLALLLGGDAPTLEVVLAWWSPVTGALTCVPVYLGARCVASRGTALGAAALVATLPVLAASSHVGNADHHSVQALLGATLLWLALALLRPSPGRPLAALAVGLALVRLTVVLLWTGSLLYVVLTDGLVIAAAALGGRRDVLIAEAASLLGAAACLAPVLLALPEPPVGPFSAVSLSWLHASVLAAGGAVAAASTATPRGLRERGPAVRLAVVGAWGLAAALLLVALPGPREGIQLALAFLGSGEGEAVPVFELMPLLPIFGRVGQPPESYYGWLAWLLPLAPLGPLLAAREARRRAPALVLAAWTAVLAVLAARQVRYGTDFAPAGSIAFALLLAAATRPLVRPGWPRALRPAVAVLLGAALLWVPIRRSYVPGLRASAAALAGRSLPAEAVLAGPVGSLSRFMRAVRAVTPETSGFLEPGMPEYGVLARPRLGHALHYRARRATPADGFLHVLGPENFAAALAFFETDSEARAVAIAGELGARYAVSMFFPGIAPGSVEARLQLDGGVGDADGTGRLEHFRLVTEGPADGAPLSDLFRYPRPRGVVPYRLFEIVAGAVLEVPAPPGSEVRARLALQSAIGRRFDYVARAEAGADGVARLRVPYPSGRGAPTRAFGPWRVTAGAEVYEVRVPEAAVREGAVVRVGADADAQNASKSSASNRVRPASRVRPRRSRSKKVSTSGTGRSRRGRSA